MSLAGQRKLVAEAKATAKAAVKAAALKGKTNKGGQEFLMKTDKRQGVVRYSLQRQLPQSDEGGKKTRQIGQVPDHQKEFLQDLLQKLRAGVLTEDDAKKAILEKKQKPSVAPNGGAEDPAPMLEGSA